LKSVEAVNERQKNLLSTMILHHFDRGAGKSRNPQKPLSGKTIAVWGLSFKPKTDDMREAPSVVIIENLLRAGAAINAHDPVAMHEARKLFKNKIKYLGVDYDALKGADALAVVTEWSEFRTPDFRKIKRLMNKPVIFDGRNIYNQAELRKMGFIYYGIGRK